jgi:ABC-type transporter Mla subunit MlaD
MSDRNSENNVKAGVFVLTSVVVGVVVIFVLGDLWGAISGPSMTDYRVSYKVSDGVGFLKPGSVVRLGGLTLGEVASVGLEADQNPDRMIGVSFTLPSDVELYSNAKASIQSGLISGDSYILISSVGWSAAERTPLDQGTPGTLLAAGDELEGTASGGMLGSFLGAETGADLAGTISNIEAISNRLQTNGYALEWILGSDEAASLSVGAKELGDVFQKMAEDGYVIEWILGEGPGADVKKLIARVKSDWFGADGQNGWSREISILLDQSDNLAKAIQDVSNIFADNMEQFQLIIDDVTVAVNDAQVTLGQLRANAPLWVADIGGALANLDLASQELLLLMQEARNAPWRLLYQPSEHEVTNELLYEASRNFVFGAADLKSAAESMDRLVAARGDALSADAKDFALVRENLNAAVARYERAQKQLSQVLHNATSPPAK